MNLVEKAVENSEAIAGVASKVTYGGAAVGIAGGLTWNELAAIAGIAAAVGGWLTNLIFKLIDNSRKRAVHAAYMRKLERESARMPLYPLSDDE